jgi:hypothetical protein
MRTGRPASSWDSFDDLRSQTASGLRRILVSPAIAVTPVSCQVLSKGQPSDSPGTSQ